MPLQDTDPTPSLGGFGLKEDGVLTRTEVDENLKVLFEKCRKRGFKLYGVAHKGIDHLYEWLTVADQGWNCNELLERNLSELHSSRPCNFGSIKYNGISAAA